jgi:uncharacterized oligopeptide transporter (OPT) family protein
VVVMVLVTAAAALMVGLVVSSSFDAKSFVRS